MSVKTETRRPGDFVLSEANGSLSRENAVIALGTHVPGTVLGQVTASGKYVALNTAASDGSQTAAAVLYGHADGTDIPAVVYKRLAEVRADLLVWPAGISGPNKTAALAALAAAHIVAR
jgi:hypothetical protein